MNALLEVKHMSKAFPGVQALDQVDLSLYPGEVHILAGENGAGKSTLMKCILGIHQADEGEIYYLGDKVSLPFQNENIVAVHQELSLVPYLNTIENIFFHRELCIGKTGVLDKKKMTEEAKKLLATLHCEHIPLDQPVKQLDVARQQMIEIAKALAAHPKILILDEPTAALSEREVNFLFEQIERLKKQGLSIIYISHRMSEFYRIGDRVTILRDGKVVHSTLLQDITEEELTHHMVGRSFAQEQVRAYGAYGKQTEREASAPYLLEVKNLCDQANVVKDCSFTVSRGEIVGIAGLVGSGRTELCELIYGIHHPKSGQVVLHGKDVTGHSPKQMVEDGLGFLTEDRKHSGLALNAPISWNVVSASLKKYFTHGFISEKKNKEIADSYVKELSITATSSEKTAKELSGGNQQKVVLAKWLAADTDLLIIDEPTRGVDIGAKMEIYHLMDELCAKGKGILVISSEMEEIMKLCDRVYVMHQGRLSESIDREECNIETIGALMWEEEECDRKDVHSKEVNTKKMGFLAKIPPAFVFTLVLMMIFYSCVDHYFSYTNIMSTLSQAAPLMVVACGQTLIVLIQGTDLSLGAMMSVTCVFWILLLQLGLPMPVAMILCLILGMLMGLLNGVVAGRLCLPIFIVTLGSQNIFRSLALLLCKNQTIYAPSKIFRLISKGTFLGFPLSVWIAGVCLALTMFILSYTKFGMRIKALGGNEEAILYAGESVEKYKILAFLYAGLMAAVAGFLLCCRIESGNPVSGNGMEFNSIAAVLIGGTSMREGKGGAGGTLFGVLLIQVLKSGLTQTGISSIYQNALIGIVVLGAIIFDAFLKNLERRKNR